LTPELVAAAGEMAEIGFPLSKIAKGIGVYEGTVYRWMQESRECPDDDLRVRFREAIHKGWSTTGKTYLRNLKEQSANGSTAAATWFLTHHPFFRDDFSDAAAERRTERRTVAGLIEAIAAAGLSREDEDRVLLHIQARGYGQVAPIEPAVPEDDGDGQD
jgi:hypothetical protein